MISVIYRMFDKFLCWPVIDAIGLLCILLKITGILTVSWWFVLAPIYVPLIIFTVLLVLDIIDIPWTLD